jgi:hypothetical protein
MDLFSKLVDLKPDFGWTQAIALCALIVSIFSWWNTRQARRSGLSQLQAVTSYEGYDTRRFGDGTGPLLYMWAIDLKNSGGRTATCRGITQRLQQLPFAVAMRGDQLSNDALQMTLYVLAKPIFEELSRNPTVLDKETPKDWDELRALNITVAPGEVKTIYFVCKITGSKPAIDGVLFNFELILSLGRSLNLSKAVRVATRSAAAA